MEAFLILVMGYMFGRSEAYHAKARKCWKDFKDGYDEGIKENK